MKYYYPVKTYILGFILVSFMIIYGIIFIYQITVVEGNSLLYALIYFAVVYIVIKWYYSQFKKYRGRYVEVNSGFIKITYRNNEEIIEKDKIELIIVAEHVQLLKVYNVTHLYTKDGRYFFFTNELIKYKNFKEDLRRLFSEQFMVREKLIIGFPTISKEFLLDNK